jgi:hypothetical protein
VSDLLDQGSDERPADPAGLSRQGRRSAAGPAKADTVASRDIIDTIDTVGRAVILD